MIQQINKTGSFKRRLTTSRGLRQQDQKDVEIGPDVEIVAYRTVMSMGTQQRVQLRIAGEALLELHYSEKGYVCVEVQGLPVAYGVRVKLTPGPDQVVFQMSETSFDIE